MTDTIAYIIALVAAVAYAWLLFRMLSNID